jgi:threonine synthase
MDILVSSNLERLLYLMSGDTELVAGLMKQLNTEGVYTVPESLLAAIKEEFWAGCCDDAQTQATIGKVWKEQHYLCDTHTAAGWAVAEEYVAATGDQAPMVVLSTGNGLNAEIVPPAGKRSFTLKFRVFHHIGVFRCLIFAPDGKLLTADAGVTLSQRMPWEQERRESSCEIKVDLPDGVDSCRAIVLAGGDIQVNVTDADHVLVKLQ